jgi:hypothetical protein
MTSRQMLLFRAQGCAMKLCASRPVESRYHSHNKEEEILFLESIDYLSASSNNMPFRKMLNCILPHIVISKIQLRERASVVKLLCILAIPALTLTMVCCLRESDPQRISLDAEIGAKRGCDRCIHSPEASHTTPQCTLVGTNCRSSI